MGMHFKVLDGSTPKSGKPLCLSCAHMSRRVGQNLEDQIVCSSYKFQGDMTGPSIVPFRVAECTEYRAFNSQGIKDMEAMAWIVQVRTRGPAGFQKKPGEPDTEAPTELEIVPPKRKGGGEDDD